MKYLKKHQQLIDNLKTIDTWSLIESVITQAEDRWSSDHDYRDDLVYDMYKEELSKRLLEAKVITIPLYMEER